MPAKPPSRKPAATPSPVAEAPVKNLVPKNLPLTESRLGEIATRITTRRLMRRAAAAAGPLPPSLSAEKLLRLLGPQAAGHNSRDHLSAELPGTVASNETAALGGTASAALLADLTDRRGNKGRNNPLYRWARFILTSLGVLAIFGLIGVVFSTLSRPGLSGPAYLALIDLNLVLLIVMVLYTTRKLLVMFLDRRGRLRHGKLHGRLVAIFGILAVVPAIVVTGMAIFLLNQGVESWFSTKVSAALEGSLQVAQAYLDEHEHGLLIETDALTREPFWRDAGLSFGTTATGGNLFLDAKSLREWLADREQAHHFDELAVVDENGTVENAADNMATLVLPPDALAALHGYTSNLGVPTKTITPQPQSFKDLNEGRVTAIAPLPGHLWLVAQRWVNPAVLARVDQTNAAYQEYFGLKQERAHIRTIFNLFLILLTGGALTGAIWTGIRLANRLVRPITALVHATNRVSAGDLTVRLNPGSDDELGILTGAFNRMALQLHNNRELIERKNHDLDERRRQMEAVLTGVTAGVASLDAGGGIRWANATASALFNMRPGGLLLKAAPELAQFYLAFMLAPRPLMQEQIRVLLADGSTKTLLVRLVPQYIEGGRVGSVVMTFDDISPLIGAQRLAAWQDVARRLAHEIKNPLTPIMLSAERLRKKYLNILPESDRELFGQLTTTIVTQAEDMRKMTNEFSDFARMPEAHMQEENLTELIQQAVLLQQSGRTDIKFETDVQVPAAETTLIADRGQLNRVIVNILENAVNAIEERPDPAAAPSSAKNSERIITASATTKRQTSAKAEGQTAPVQKGSTSLPQGHIKVVVRKTQPDILIVEVNDNGRGLPAEVEVEQLFDPYITTRRNGTGLGLAIVRRVIDEHGGTVTLRRREAGGTQVEITLTRRLPEPEIV